MTASPLNSNTVGRSRGSFAIAEGRDEGGPPRPPRLIAPLYVHRRDEEGWYVLEGRLLFRLDGREVEAPVDSAVVVPPGVGHASWNPGPERSRYLLVMTPDLRALIEDLHSPADRTGCAVRAAFRDHGLELFS